MPRYDPLRLAAPGCDPWLDRRTERRYVYAVYCVYTPLARRPYVSTMPITTRLPEWLDEELRRLFDEYGEGRSEGLRRVAEEWWVTSRFPSIGFRDGPAGRRAVVRGGPDVWEVVMVWREYEGDVDAVREHFGGRLRRDEIDQALAYYERFRDAIDATITENERIGRYLEQRRAAG